MGSGIAEVAARSGCDVKIVENNDGALQAGMQRIEKSLDRAMRAGKLSEEDHAQVMGNISFSTKLPSLADRELVVELSKQLLKQLSNRKKPSSKFSVA